MTDQTTSAPATPAERPRWTTPKLEEIGTIHDVEGGQNAGNDTNGQPSRIF